MHMALNYWFHPPSRTCSVDAASSFFAPGDEAAIVAAVPAATPSTDTATDNKSKGLSGTRAAQEERMKQLQQWTAVIEEPYEDTFWEDYTKPLLAAHEALRQKFVFSAATTVDVDVSSHVAQETGGEYPHRDQRVSQTPQVSTGALQPEHALLRTPVQHQDNQRKRPVVLNKNHQTSGHQRKKEQHTYDKSEMLGSPRKKEEASVSTRPATQNDRQHTGNSRVRDKGMNRVARESRDIAKQHAEAGTAQKSMLEAGGYHEKYRLLSWSKRPQRQLLRRAWRSHMFLKYAGRRCTFYKVPFEFCYKTDAMGTAQYPPCFAPVVDE